ncbi:MAG TPA: hypothetical protein VFQ91_24890 [Bryobacteraceae bacterium]|nr:hypothetical protein [Bryobacteraceae bacterium]
MAFSAGWGWWLYWWLFRDAPLSANRISLLLAAGISLQILLIGNLAFADFTVHQTFWIPIAVGLAGLVHAGRNYRAFASLDRRQRKELAWMSGVFAVVFAIQGISLFHTGPYDYYGVGTIDHINYVLVAQALLDRPLSFNSLESGPWLYKFVAAKHFRLGQSFLHAYLAAGMSGNAKESFGPISVMFIALSGMFSYLVARLLSIGRTGAAAVGIWAGVSLAATRIHTFGFLSQDVTLFVLPALFVAVRAFGAAGWRAHVVPSLLLAHMFVSYTEFFPFAVLGYGGYAAIGPWSGFFRRAWLASAAVCAAVFYLPAYIPDAIRFVQIHAGLLKLGPVAKLDDFAPFGGTMYGWARDLVSIGRLVPLSERSIITLCGYWLIALILFAFFSRPTRKFLWLAALLLPFVVGLAVLFQKPHIPKYQVWKVQLEYSWLCVLFVILGFARLRELLRTLAGRAVSFAAVAVGGIVVASGVLGGALEQRDLVRLEHNFVHVATVQNATSIAIFDALEAQPPEGIILSDRLGLLNAWLAYHARHIPTYSLGAPISDMGPVTFPPPPGKTDLPLVTGAGLSRDVDLAFPPAITVRSPQGTDRDPASPRLWYWMAKSFTVQIDRLPQTRPPKLFEVAMTVTPGPASPSPLRRIAYVNTATGEHGELAFSQLTVATFPIHLVSGSNTLQFTLVEPAGGLTQRPPDPRILAVRIENIKVRPAAEEGK